MTNKEAPRDDAIRVPLAEESLTARIVEREQGAIRIHTRVEQIPVQADVDLTTQHVEVSRHARDEVVTDMRAPWHDGDDLVIPRYEERLVTEKRLVLVEEVRVHLSRQTESIHLQETVRKEVIDVEEISVETDTSAP